MELYFQGVKTLIDIITGDVVFSMTVFTVVMIAGTLLSCGIGWRHSRSGNP